MNDKWKITGFDFSNSYVTYTIESISGIYNLINDIQTECPNLDLNRITNIKRMPNEIQD